MKEKLTYVQVLLVDGLLIDQTTVLPQLNVKLVGGSAPRIHHQKLTFTVAPEAIVVACDKMEGLYEAVV